MADEMYDESDPAPVESEEQSVANGTNDTAEKKSDETEDQLSLVPKHFFKEEPKPGNREMVEIVEVYEGEVSIRCVYGDKDDKEEPEGESESEPAPEAEDSMMV